MTKLNHMAKPLILLGFTTIFLGCAATQKQDRTVDDSVITTNATTAISNDTTLKKQQINVKTVNGEVQLSGTVDSEQIIRRAGEAVGSINGVANVKNDLTVK